MLSAVKAQRIGLQDVWFRYRVHDVGGVAAVVKENGWKHDENTPHRLSSTTVQGFLEGAAGHKL